MAVSTQTPQAIKRLIENLQMDLRSLSAECKRKYPPVKEAAEAGLLKIRNLMGRQQDLVTGLLESGVDIVHPFILGCDTKNPKIVGACLMSLQRLIQHQIISPAAVNNIIDTLWLLMESGIEELKLLQTVILLITINSIVKQQALSKALVLCFRLHFGKDSITINTAAATVRQLVTSVFERIVMDDTQPPTGIPPVTLEELKASRSKPPPSLTPSAADAFMMFQDVCHLVNAEQPTWLLGMTEMTRTFGLEIIESLLTDFPHVFIKHNEFSFLLKERVCPLIIKLFSPSLKYKVSAAASGNSVTGSAMGASASNSDKPFFPIVMRLLRLVATLIKQYAELLVTECEIFLTLLVKFLDPEKPLWQRTLALEVLCKLSYHPVLIRSFCAWYDLKPHSSKVLKDIMNGLASFVQSQFAVSSQSSAPRGDTTGAAPALVGGMPVGAGVTPQPAFCYRGVWIPFVVPIPASGHQHKPVCLEMPDRVEPPAIVEGYALSVAFLTMLEIVRSIHSIIERTVRDVNIATARSSEGSAETGSSQPTAEAVDQELLNSSWCGVLAALTLLLDASTEESATEATLKALQMCAYLCGKLQMTTSRDAFMTALCKASLPPHYSLTVLSSAHSHTHARVPSHGRSTSLNSESGLSGGESTVPGNQVVAVGTPLPQASHPLGSQNGQVMLTAKNIYCMRALLNMAHCHGGVLGTAWHQVLTTLQHLSWILGLKPAHGGTLKADNKAMDTSNGVITTAVMADLPVLAQMLSRLFESSQYLDDVALHHLIDALCQLCTEACELASANKEPSLFSVAKLLETGLVNLARVEVLWRPVMAKLFEVCQHSYGGLRTWGAEAVTALTKAALSFNFTPPLHEQPKLQALLLGPLQDLSTLTYADIRQKQLDCVTHVLHSNGERLAQGWPAVLVVIGAVKQQHSENLVRTAFTCLQLVCTDFLPTMPCMCLQPVVDVAAKFGLQHQELNVSLTAVGLLWNISDHFYQHRVAITKDLDAVGDELPWRPADTPAFDALWLWVYARLGDLCVDSRPSVRKSAGQTLFSMLGAHGNLLQKPTWHRVLWKVLFPLLEQVTRGSGEASDVRQTGSEAGGAAGSNILIHHSRDTAQKQWAETQVLSLAGVARVFTSKRAVLRELGDFKKGWSMLLEYVEKSALCKNSEVSLAALKSFQEMLQIRPESGTLKDEFQHLFENPHKKPTPPGVIIAPPISEKMMRNALLFDEEPATVHTSTGDNKGNKQQEVSKSSSNDGIDDLSLWLVAWKVWLNIGTVATTPPNVNTDNKTTNQSKSSTNNAAAKKDKLYIPSQAFLTALVRIFPTLYEHIKPSFGVSDITRLYGVLSQAVTVPVHSDSSPFILPVGELTLTGLQQAVLDSVQVLQKDMLEAPGDSTSLPELFRQLLVLVSYATAPPRFGQLEATSVAQAKASQTDWVFMNYVPLAEGVLLLVVSLYTSTASNASVIKAGVLPHIIETLHGPLALKYGCPSQSTWVLAIESLLSLLHIALPIVAKNEAGFKDIWNELGKVIEDFLFPTTSPPPTLSIEEFQKDEAIDCKVVEFIRKEVLSHANIVPKDFVAKVMHVLNKGSIHSAASSNFIDIDSSKKLREEFAKFCFETLLQFSFNTTQEKEGSITSLAVSSLLERCHNVLVQYVKDEKLSGKCPLPRPRVAEMAFVLKAISTLLASLKKAPKNSVDASIWKQVVELYPALVHCTVCTSVDVCRALEDALIQYQDLLVIPDSYQSATLSNGAT